MNSCPDPAEQIAVILSDAGCTGPEIRQFLQYWQQGQHGCWRRFLEQHRQQLLEALHADKLRIDRLDFLTDWLERSDHP